VDHGKYSKNSTTNEIWICAVSGDLEIDIYDPEILTFEAYDFAIIVEMFSVSYMCPNRTSLEHFTRLQRRVRDRGNAAPAMTRLDIVKKK
jgi:hypothetical protein